MLPSNISNIGYPRLSRMDIDRERPDSAAQLGIQIIQRRKN